MGIDGAPLPEAVVGFAGTRTRRELLDALWTERFVCEVRPAIGLSRSTGSSHSSDCTVLINVSVRIKMSRLSDLLRAAKQLDPQLGEDLEAEIQPLQKRLPSDGLL